MEKLTYSSTTVEHYLIEKLAGIKSELETYEYARKSHLSFALDLECESKARYNYLMLKHMLNMINACLDFDYFTASGKISLPHDSVAAKHIFNTFNGVAKEQMETRGFVGPYSNNDLTLILMTFIRDYKRNGDSDLSNGSKNCIQLKRMALKQACETIMMDLENNFWWKP